MLISRQCRIFRITLLAAAISLNACAAGTSADAQDEIPLTTPIALYVPRDEPFSVLPRRQKLSEFLEAYHDDEPRFDEEFRSVPEPETPISIDCTNVTHLVVVVHIDGTGRSRTLLNSVKLRYRWTHSELELEGGKHNDVGGEIQTTVLSLDELDDTRYALGPLRLSRPY